MIDYTTLQEVRVKDLERTLELKLAEVERSAQQQVKENDVVLGRLKADMKREHEVGA